MKDSISLSKDLCYMVANGEWIMPKYIILMMTIRHLAES